MGYTAFTTLIGHPAERLKVAIQTNLFQSSFSVTKQFLGGNLNHFSTGFMSCVLRQQGKVIYRPLLITHMPNAIDGFNFSIIFGGLLKASIASSFDTLVLSPFENIKTVQMKTIANQNKPIKPIQAAQLIYQQRGLPGFFAGSTATMGKAFPSWFYLFVTYQAIKTKREKQSFLHTILWATAASGPISLMTTPLDVIKSQQQACSNEMKKTVIGTAKDIYHVHGVMAFLRELIAVCFIKHYPQRGLI